ncbi:hypothetical protein C8R45DRAFT_947191 [Mycena sanguinolenta]|nr:hypothetical protein C8R45DRAFT_947191 [Mycena sanguinolenta]
MPHEGPPCTPIFFDGGLDHTDHDNDAGKFYYVVVKGKEPGIYFNNADGLAQVHRVHEARWEKFPTKERAVEYWNGCCLRLHMHEPPKSKSKSFCTLKFQRTYLANSETSVASSKFELVVFFEIYPAAVRAHSIQPLKRDFTGTGLQGTGLHRNPNALDDARTQISTWNLPRQAPNSNIYTVTNNEYASTRTPTTQLDQRCRAHPRLEAIRLAMRPTLLHNDEVHRVTCWAGSRTRSDTGVARRGLRGSDTQAWYTLELHVAMGSRASAK